jgi:hypothetical protein
LSIALFKTTMISALGGTSAAFSAGRTKVMLGVPEQIDQIRQLAAPDAEPTILSTALPFVT